MNHQNCNDALCGHHDDITDETNVQLQSLVASLRGQIDAQEALKVVEDAEADQEAADTIQKMENVIRNVDLLLAELDIADDIKMRFEIVKREALRVISIMRLPLAAFDADSAVAPS